MFMRDLITSKERLTFPELVKTDYSPVRDFWKGESWRAIFSECGYKCAGFGFTEQQAIDNLVAQI